MEQGTVKSHLLQQAEALAKDCTTFAESLRQERDCHDVMLGIMQLAMVNKGIIDIHAQYVPHTDSFTGFVVESDSSYQADTVVWIYSFDVNFSFDKNPLQMLLEVEDKLLELIADAKDKAEVAA
ncbi:hypothetical protein [Photobacterium lipolyticum]|uniref:Uncharacterized protein n=1 Tax=Photobacterium lipolyticum TaxID=266810 RepID=A0A2T3N063_9GAMM|nr:hypothetical protein [Photobacterium lipolyticum]PSW05659.1 hypothetical protein C9I89_07880 [Photobacterium lipolyticum]